MDQMNVSMTDHLAGYVRKKVKSGRYNNASEVVRAALRLLEQAELPCRTIARPRRIEVVPRGHSIAASKFVAHPVPKP